MKSIKIAFTVMLIAFILVACGTDDNSAEIYENNEQNLENSAEENKDEVNWDSQEEITSYPPEEEYDEIILQDEQYYLCKKTESGFDTNAEYYGIYDSDSKKWAFEYRELPLGDMKYYDFCSHGNGVFSYKYSSYHGTVCFLSAELNGTFETEKVYNRDKVLFKNGKALVLFYEESNYVTINGKSRIAPDKKLCWVTTWGEIEEVHMSGFEEDDMYYWSESYITGPYETEIYAIKFANYCTGERQSYIYVYFYADGTYTIIDNQDYTTKVVEYIGDVSDCVNVELHDELIYIENLKGEDDRKYYAEFDREGNIVTSATLME